MVISSLKRTRRYILMYLRCEDIKRQAKLIKTNVHYSIKGYVIMMIHHCEISFETIFFSNRLRDFLMRNQKGY